MSDEGVLFNGCWICRRTTDELDGIRMRIFSHAIDSLNKLKKAQSELPIDDVEERARDCVEDIRLKDTDEFMVTDYTDKGQLFICGVCYDILWQVAATCFDEIKE